MQHIKWPPIFTVLFVGCSITSQYAENSDFDHKYSDNYNEAKINFSKVAIKNGFSIEHHPLTAKGPDGNQLSIDVAIYEPPLSPSRQTLLISSGLHGMEDFFGAAVQLQLMQISKALISKAPYLRIVFIHTVNPYGLAWLRRNNEDNVDLNRNFLLANESYSGVPEGYKNTAEFLAPEQTPSRLDFFYFKLMFNAIRYGLSALTKDIPSGQYEYPKGLFFGGKSPTESHLIIDKNIKKWVGQSKKIFHLDLHSGLYPAGQYYILQDNFEKQPDQDSFEKAFKNVKKEEEVLYSSRGTWMRWMSHRFRSRNIHSVVAEFGTIHNLRVLNYLKNENQNYWYGEKTQLNHWTKQNLRDAFIPESVIWRRDVIGQSLGIVDEAIDWLQKI